MRRREPPGFATWMLEHLASGDPDEALGGDLLEEFRRGRSDGWYWRQVLAACAVSWMKSLRGHSSLLTFVFLWSMLAPAWKVLSDQIQDYQIFIHTWQMLRGFWLLPAFALWATLHAAFLWAGMLTYILSNNRVGKTFREEKVRRAFLLAPLIFLPVFGAIFVLMNLYSFPGLVNDRLATTPLGQIADLRMPADVLRIPYFIALLSALWGVIPRAIGNSEPILVDSTPIESQTGSDTLALFSTLDPLKLRQYLGFMVGAGLINALIGGFLLCRLPESHSPSLISLFIRAIIYVAVGVVGGVAGTWFYWRNPSSPFRKSSPLPFTQFALVCAAGWTWVPSMAILSEQISAATALVAMIGAFVLASGLRSATYLVFAPSRHALSTLETEDAELFAASLSRPPVEIHGYAIAISMYAASAALLTRSIYSATVLLAFGAFLFAWKRTIPRSRPLVGDHPVPQAALRLARVAVPAVLVTAWALLDGVNHRNQAAQATAAFAANKVSPSEASHEKSVRQASAYRIGGYESLILWPYPEKKQIAPPLPIEESLLAPGTTHPMVLRFNGAYWYVQPPDKRPGPMAHEAHGTPLGVNIQSNNSSPVVMDAHQNLSTSIRITRCRQIEVGIENSDNKAGSISLALLLTDRTAPQRPELSLGQQPIVSTEPGHFSFKRSPVYETVHFSVPPIASIKKFNEITVLVLPDIEHTFVAPKVAIVQFQLFPR
jgi:hypothetical protein